MNVIAKSNKWYFQLALFIALIVVLAFLPNYTSGYPVILFSTILMFAVMTVSWTIFSGSTGYISLATAAFFGVGVYVTAILGRTMPFPLVVLIGALMAMCLAAITGAITLRLKGIYFTIFTFGLVALMQAFILWWEINLNHVRGRMVIVVENTTIFYYMLGIFAVMLLAAYFIRRSKFGLALQSIGLDEEATSHIGVNVTLLKIIVFSLSALFVGAAGAVMSTRWSYIDPYIAFNMNYSFFPVLMAIFGGTGNIFGPVIGAAIFAYLEEKLLTTYPYYYMLTFGLVLVATITFLPNGIINGIIGLIRRQRRGGLVKSNGDTPMQQSQ
jgi:branched-chain amino acid transport system permease protein